MNKFYALLLLVPSFLLGNLSYQIHNRPLAKVEDRVITLMDLVKQMDSYLYTNRLTPSAEERVQFYKNNWKYVLDQCVDSELMLLIAKERELTVSEGDVREEMFRRYGSNMQTTLAELKLSYLEAKEMVEHEMIVEQVQGYNIQAKAMQEVTPQEVKNAYFAYLLSHPATKEWTYQVLSITGDDPEISSQGATKAYELLHDKNLSPLEVKESLAQETKLNISLSQEYTSEEKKLSESHKSILTALKKGEVSLPEKQISRSTGKPAYRLFIVKHFENKGAPLFNEMENKLKSALLQAKSHEESVAFYAKLREKYHYTPLATPPDYEPFTFAP